MSSSTTGQPSSSRSASSSTKWRRRITWIALFILASVLVLVAGAVLWDGAASARAATQYPPRGEFVDVGGAKMHVICQGSGEPVLAMQGGIAGGAIDWLPLMNEMAPGHRVCAFDRLGQDWSDPAPTPRTFDSAADEWHRAMESMGIEEPIVVGHSLGGAVVQLYAATYPVSGVVLVDGLTAHAAPEVVQRFATYQTLDPLGRAGLLRPMGSLFADRAYPSALRSEMSALRARSDSLLAVTAEGSLAAATLPERLAEAEAQLSTPLLVIAAGQTELPEAEAFYNGLEGLAERHPAATFVTVPEAKHYVIASHPQEIAEFVELWLNDVSKFEE